MADKDAERFEPGQAFVDLEGTIPAKPGDKVALIRGGLFIGGEAVDLVQHDPARRPTLTEDGVPSFNTSADDLADRL